MSVFDTHAGSDAATSSSNLQSISNAVLIAERAARRRAVRRLPLRRAVMAALVVSLCVTQHE